MNLLFILPITTAAFSTTRPLSRVFGAAVARTGFESSSLLKNHREYQHQLHTPLVHHQLYMASSVSSDSGGNGDGNMTKILGVCGGIGSGKSTACQLMVDTLGCVARIGTSVQLYYL